MKKFEFFSKFYLLSKNSNNRKRLWQKLQLDWQVHFQPIKSAVSVTSYFLNIVQIKLHSCCLLSIDFLLQNNFQKKKNKILITFVCHYHLCLLHKQRWSLPEHQLPWKRFKTEKYNRQHPFKIHIKTGCDHVAIFLRFTFLFYAF